MSKKRVGFGLLVAAMISVFFAGCGVFESEGGGGTDESGGEDAEVLRDYLAGDISTLDTAQATDGYSFNVINNFVEGLYRLDENEEPVPGVAESVEVSDDGLSYTFTLRDDARWSDGEPMVSEDFRYAWLRAMDPEVAGSYAFLLSEYIEGGAEYNAGDGSADDVAIRTPDERTLEVALANPTPFFLSLTAFPTYMPLREDFVEEQGDEYAQTADNLLSNGPYVLTEYNPSDGVVFEKNEEYWDKGNVDIETVDARVIGDAQTALNLYESDELDVVALDSENVERFSDSDEFVAEAAFETLILYMNNADETLANENIRKALQRGFDREAYVDGLLGGVSEPAYGLVPPEMAGPDEDESFREFTGDVIPEFDPDEARELYERGVEELGEEPTIEISVSDISTSQDAGTFLQSQWEENLGADVEVRILPFDALLEAAGEGEYQISASTWIADFNDPINYLDLFTTNSSFNDPNFESEEYDDLISGAKSEEDAQTRMEMLRDAERLLLDGEAAIAPVYYAEAASLVKPNVTYETHPFAPGVDYKLAEMDE